MFFLVVQPKLTLHGVAFSGLNGPLFCVKGGLSQYSESSCFAIERFHSRGHHLYKFIGTKESVCIRKEFISHRIVLVLQHGRRFIVLEHQCGRRDVMWKRFIATYTATSGDLFELMKKIDQRSDDNSKWFNEGASGWALIFSAFFPLHLDMDLVRVHLSTSSPGLFPQFFEGKALGTRLVHLSIHFYLFGLIVTAIIFNSLLLS